MADSSSPEGQEKDLKGYKGPEGVVSRWLKELRTVQESKAQKAFETIGERIVKQYRNQSALNEYTSAKAPAGRVMMNILWSNVEVMGPCLYARMPKVVVERRFKDSDPVGRMAATICERSTSFMLSSQQDRFNFGMKAVVKDRNLPGRGQMWLRYDAEFVEQTDANGEPLLDDEGNAIRAPKPNTEKVIPEYVNWMDYFESAARTPYEVRWKAKRVYMTRSELVKRFGGEIGNEVELTHNPEGLTKKRISSQESQFLLQAEVFEIEDFDSKQRIWISEGYKAAPLDQKEDVLKLNDFWASPIPLLATTTTDSQYPTPDAEIWRRLGDELDATNKRISSIIDCIRVVGVYCANMKDDVKSLLKKPDGTLVPIDNWAALLEKGGLRGAIDWFAFDNAVAALPVLFQYRDDLINQINIITGIPDIAQGSTDPNETADAQQRKSHWAVIKLREKAADVQRFCREVISKMAEIIFEDGLFADETIALMCGVAQMSPEEQSMFQPALALLRDDRLRTFRVDIETDSTVNVDEQVDIESRMEFLGAMNQVISNLQQISQFRPELMDPAIESAMFVIRGFRNGRAVEGSLEKAMQAIKDNDQAAAEQAAQNPQPDYEAGKLEIESRKVGVSEQELQLKGMEVQIKQQAEMFDEWYKSEDIKIKGSQVMSDAEKAQLDQQLDTLKMQFDQFVGTKTLELEQYRVVLDEKEKFLEEARLAQEHRLAERKAAVDAVKSITE
jgi:hypothetical protein